MRDTNQRILIVEDEAPMCELLTSFFSEKAYNVDTAQNGEHAIARLREKETNAAIVRGDQANSGPARCFGIDNRVNRNGKGTGRARDSLQLRSTRRSVYAYKLFGDPRHPA